MKKSIILDPAHGIDTLGKRSPDGLHREYLWSRKILSNIYIKLVNSTGIYIYYPFMFTDKEPGLTNRVLKYNDIAKYHDETLVLSLHNDAYKNEWSNPHGVSVWTSRGDDESDNYATSLFTHLQSRYPNEKFRAAKWLSEKEKIGDPDWEANFTILAGNSKVKPLYNAVLLEWLFQTNKDDVIKLMNPIHNEYFEDMITEWIINNF